LPVKQEQWVQFSFGLGRIVITQSAMATLHPQDVLLMAVAQHIAGD